MNESFDWLSPGLTGGIAAGVLTPIILLLLNRFKSLRPTEQSPRSLESLHREYRWWEAGSGFIFLAISAFFAALLTWVAYQISAVLNVLEPAGAFPFVIDWMALMLPSFFLGMMVAIPPSYRLMRKMLGDHRYEEYIDYYNRRYGVNVQKVLTGLAIIIVPLTLLLYAMMLNTRYRVDEREIVFSGFTELSSHHYSYDQVDDVELLKSFKAPNGNIIRKHQYIIHFNDGNLWALRDTLSGLDLQQQGDIARFVMKQSGKPLTVNNPY